MKVLVLGYSVTAEKNGYVHKAQARISRPGVVIDKVGYGGMKPDQARHLFPDLINARSPDIVILEQATPAILGRGQRGIEADTDYRNSILSIVRLCAEKNIRFGLLDLPRSNVNYDRDWVTALHRNIAEGTRSAYKRVSLDDGFLNDAVHPTEKATDVYADAFLEIIAKAEYLPSLSEFDFGEVPEYNQIQFARRAPSAFARRSFERAGAQTELVVLPANETLEIDLEEDLLVKGCSFLMGPQTSTLHFALGDFREDFEAYDKYCYYSRINANRFNFDGVTRGVRASRICVQQSDKMPSVPLRKGTVDCATREGGLGSILVERHCQ